MIICKCNACYNCRLVREGKVKPENAELSLKAEARIEELEEALQKAREDINWMLNSKEFLNGFVFDYIDKVLENK